MMTPAELLELDPGIRDVVAELQAAGFNTTDSGDGVTKLLAGGWDPDEVLDMAHVISQTDADNATTEARRLQSIVEANAWDARVELSWSPSDDVWILALWFARPRVVA